MFALSILKAACGTAILLCAALTRAAYRVMSQAAQEWQATHQVGVCDLVADCCARKLFQLLNELRDGLDAVDNSSRDVL